MGGLHTLREGLHVRRPTRFVLVQTTTQRVTIMELTLDPTTTENERYGDEVLNANWLPQPGVLLSRPPAVVPRHERNPAGAEDPESFLRRLYLLQE
ncbi:MAG: hypothetical protein RJA63_3924 [Pseudomonadota bacterium]